MTDVDVKQITRTSNGLKILAPAKLNLSLLIAGKRPDGFHEIETIMSKINLYDELFIEQGTQSDIELMCSGPEWAPDGKENLVYKACRMILEKAGKKANVKITLTKRIPAGGGLASASTDAVATLIGVNMLFKLGVSDAELYELASSLGSDVAFFLGGPMAICRGRGEKYQQIDRFFEFNAILILPNVSCSTPKVYANYRHDQGRFEQLKVKIGKALEKNNIEILSQMCANMLDVSCFELYSELSQLKALVESLGIRPLCLSGSGSSMYHILDKTNGGQADECIRRIQERTGCRSIIISSNSW